MALTPIGLAEQIRTCLCTNLAASMAGPTCRCYVYPSPQPPADVCSKSSLGNGQATVSIVRTFPSVEFPTPDDSGRCDAYLAVEVSITVYRCAPTVSDSGVLPPVSDYEEATEILLSDAEAMKCAIVCCLPNGYQFIVSEWEMLVPSGGCMGGTITGIIGIDNQSCVPAP